MELASSDRLFFSCGQPGKAIDSKGVLYILPLYYGQFPFLYHNKYYANIGYTSRILLQSDQRQKDFLNHQKIINLNQGFIIFFGEISKNYCEGMIKSSGELRFRRKREVRPGIDFTSCANQRENSMMRQMSLA